MHSLQCHAFVLPSCIGRGRGLSIALLLAVLWLVGIPVGAKSITTVSPQPNVVAAADTSMVAYTEKKTCAKIPSAYKNKIDSVLKENLYVIELNGTNSWSFTTDFVIKEMESDWGISKDNQLMFIWISLCEVLSGEYPYDGESGDSKMIEEFEKAFKYIDACGKRYKVGIMPFIEKKSAEFKQRSAEADRRIEEARKQSEEYDRRIAEARKQSAEARKQSEEYDRRIAEARKQSEEYDRRIAEARKQSEEARKQSEEARKETMKADSLGIREMVKYYNLCIKNPATNDRNEMQAVISAARDIIQNCKKFGIDYRAIILKEVSDRRKVDEILKFYGVESK